MSSGGSGRRYLRRSGVAMLFYVVSILAATYLISRGLVHGPPAWILALLPGVSVAGLFYAIGMRIVEMDDEYLRILMVRQVLYATGITLALTTIWGFLELFGMVGHIELYLVSVLWCVSLPLGALINRFTHGSWGSCL